MIPEKKDNNPPSTQKGAKTDAPQEIKHGSAESGMYRNGDIYTTNNEKFTFKDGEWVSEDGTKKYKNFEEIQNASK